MPKTKSARAEQDPLFESGLKVRKQVLTAEYVDRQFASASEWSAPMQRLATQAWGLTWARPGLPHKARSMLNIAFLVALDKPEELELHVTAALRNGVTPDEVMEILVQSAVYCGFPAALKGTRIARQALERWISGEGATASRAKSGSSRSQRKSGSSASRSSRSEGKSGSNATRSSRSEGKR